MKQRIYKSLLALGLASIMMTACDGYLDIVPKGNVILTDVEQCANILNNSSMQVYPTAGIEPLVDDTWYNPGVVLDKGRGSSILVDHFIYTAPSPTYNRFNMYTSSSVGIYRNCFERISKMSNLVLDNIDKVTGDEQLKKLTAAEARALRAYNYFILVNVFGKQYDPQTAATDLAVPLYEHFDLESRPAQATVAQLYKFIEDDLDAAIPSLSNTPVNNLHFSKAAAYLLKAKVHLMKLEFAKAKEAATESYKLNSYVFDFRTISSLNAIAKFNQNPENLYMAGVASIGYMSSISLGVISQDLATLFGATQTTVADVKDTRFSQFFSYTTSSAGDPNGATESKRLDALYTPAYDSRLNGPKFYVYNSAGLRTTDAILILAECCARDGDYTNMKKYLDEVRSKRIIGYTTATENPTNKVEAVNIVINERRKEFITGFGRWLDMRRLNMEPDFRKTYTRKAPANPDKDCGYVQTEYSLPPDSYLWIIPLPEDEFSLYGEGLKYNVPY